MGKDKKNQSRSATSSTWDNANSTGFIGFSAFTSNIANATDPDFQLDSEYQVHFKMLQKKNSTSRLKALQELSTMFSGKLDVNDGSVNVKSILNAWTFVFEKLVNDDDRKVREVSFTTLEILGLKVGKLLASNIKALMGPWIMGIVDQRDQSTNTAQHAFESIFPEKKRLDVLMFTHQQVIQYIGDKLKETPQSLNQSTGGGVVDPEVLQDRYDRCISNALMSIEYLMNRVDCSSPELNEIYQSIFEDQFFSFLSSKSVVIRRTCYRIINGIVNQLPLYCENNIKDLSSKILGLFSEKDSSTHLFMWNAIISFLKKYKEKAWKDVDARKHVLPRFFTFIKSGCYGSHELSYPSILPFLSFVPDSVIGSGPEFFKEFFTNLYKGLPVLDKIKQYNTNEKATHYLLSCLIECLLYSIKRYSNNQDIINYLLNDVVKELFINYFTIEPCYYTESFISKSIADLLIKLNQLNIQDVNSKLDKILQESGNQIINRFNQKQEQQQEQQSPLTPITTSTLLIRLSNLFGKTKDIIPYFKPLSIQLFQYCKNNQQQEETIFQLQSILLSNFNPNDLITNLNEYLTIIIDRIKSNNQESEMNNLIKLYSNILDSANQDIKIEFWKKIITVLNQKDFKYLVLLIESIKLTSRPELCCQELDQKIQSILKSNSPVQFKSLFSGSKSLFSVLILSNNIYNPIINTKMINECMDWLHNQLMIQLMLSFMSVDTINGEDIEYLLDPINLLIEYVPAGTTDLDKNIKLLVQDLVKSTLQYSQTNLANQFINTLIPITKLERLISNPLEIILELIFDKLFIDLNQDDFEFFLYLIKKCININNINVLFKLYTTHQVKLYSLVQSQIKIQYLNSNILPLASSNQPAKQETKELGSFYKLNLFMFKVVEGFNGLDTIVKESTFNDEIIVNLIQGLLTVDCNNSNENNYFLTQLKSMQQFKVQLIQAIMGGNNTIITQLPWFKSLLDNNKNNLLVKTQLIKMVLQCTLKDLDNVQDMDSLMSVLGLESVEKIKESWGSMTLFQGSTILEHCINCKHPIIQQLRSVMISELDQLTSSLPNELEPVAITISLFTTLYLMDLQESQENQLTKQEQLVLFQVLQLIQQWYLRFQNQLKEDSEFELLQLSLSNFLFMIAKLIISQQQPEFLSTNQSLLIQNLLVNSIKDELDSDCKIYKKYNYLKLFNIILNNQAANQKILLPNTDSEFIIDLSNQIIVQWLNNYKLIQKEQSIEIFYELLSITIEKIPKSIQYKIVQNNISPLYQQITNDKQLIQLTTYKLLKSYYQESETQPIKLYILSEQEKDYEFILNDQLASLLNDFNTWELYYKDKSNLNVKSKLIGNLMIWDLILLNYSNQIDDEKKQSISSYLNQDKRISKLLDQLFKCCMKKKNSLQSSQQQYDENNNNNGGDIEEEEFRICKEFPTTLLGSRNIITMISGYLIFKTILILPSMARCWWSDDCSTKQSSLVNKFVAKYISPLVFENEIQLIEQHKEPAGSIFSLKTLESTKQVIASYEKDEMVISISLTIPDTYPLRVLSVEFAKRVGVTEMQWKKWLLSMTSLLLTRDGSILDVCLLWKTSLDKHFDGVEVCPICYSLFHNGTIPKFQCKTCKNKFHSGCIYTWLSVSHKTNCPLCQSQLT